MRMIPAAPVSAGRCCAFSQQPISRSAIGTIRDRPPLLALTARDPALMSRSNTVRAASSEARMLVE